MQIRSILPATDWFFVFRDVTDRPIVFPVAAWALVDAFADDLPSAVVGMLGNAPTSSLEHNTPRLVTPPVDVHGVYKHRDQLFRDEREAINQNPG